MKNFSLLTSILVLASGFANANDGHNPLRSFRT